MSLITLSKEHYTLPNGKLGSIHMKGNFFLDVEKETEKAIFFQYFGKRHWLPKSAFIGSFFGDMVVFTIKPFFSKQIMDKF